MKNGLIVFVILGRLGGNLSTSKLAPICSIESISKVYAFSESDGNLQNEKLSYITLPAFFSKGKSYFFIRILRWFYEPLQLFYYVLKYRPNFINGVYTLPKGLYSFVISKLLNRFCIISIIGGKEEIETEFRFPKFWKTLNLFIIKHSWAITCKGNKDLEYLKKEGIDTCKAYVFNGSIDLSRFRNHLKYREIDLIFVGKFDTNKGPLRILEIVKELVLEFKDFNCVLLGDGYLKKSVEREIITLGLQKNIKCIGFVDNPEFYYQQSKIFVLPSTNEGLSTAMLESMSCGCVPIVSDVGNTSDAVKNKMNGILINSYDDIHSYVSNIRMLIKDREIWSVYSRNAEITVTSYYSLKAQAQLYEKVLSI